MDKKPKKQIHKPTFLYLDKGSLAPKETPQRPPSEDSDLKKEPPPQQQAAAPQQQQLPPPSSNIEMHNNLLVGLIDALPSINHFFQLPDDFLDLKQTPEIKQMQAYRDSDGTYAELLAAAGNDKPAFDKKINPLAAQRYALLQLWVKAEDAHGNNMLIKHNSNEELIPVPINYVRCLAYDFTDNKAIPRTTRWENWPQLNYPLVPEVRALIMKTDAASLAAELAAAFNQRARLSAEEKEIFQIKLAHFEANVAMVQEAVKEGLTLKQILALILPQVDKFSFNFVTGGVVQGGELWPARDRFQQLNTSFHAAWNKGRRWQGFSLEAFKKQMDEEIAKIKKMEPDKLFELYFSEAPYELRRALFL